MVIRTSDYEGFVHGLATFTQLIEKEKETEKYVIKNTPIHITDEPEYEYRGIMLDVSRHFFPVETIERLMDSMTLVKLNKLHLHLSDYDSYPLYSDAYPGLQNVTSFSPDERYTKNNIAELVTYGAARGITIIPEVDSPAHMNVFGNLPELKELFTCYNFRNPYHGIHAGPDYGQLDPTLDKSYEFIGNLLKEIDALFPGDMIHLGGDEVLSSCWETRPEIKKFMDDHNIETYTDLQNYYTARL